MSGLGKFHGVTLTLERALGMHSMGSLSFTYGAVAGVKVILMRTQDNNPLALELNVGLQESGKFAFPFYAELKRQTNENLRPRNRYLQNQARDQKDCFSNCYKAKSIWLCSRSWIAS